MTIQEYEKNVNRLYAKIEDIDRKRSILDTEERMLLKELREIQDNYREACNHE